MEHKPSCNNDFSYTQVGSIDDSRDILQCGCCGAIEFIASSTPRFDPFAMDFSALELRVFAHMARCAWPNLAIKVLGATPTGRISGFSLELQRLPFSKGPTGTV